MDYIGEEFVGRTLSLDTDNFARCRIIDCILEYSGQGGAHLEDCVLDGSSIRFAGRAAYTVRFLQDMARSGPSGLDALMRIFFMLPDAARALPTGAVVPDRQAKTG
jgi:hypothetical protein